MSGISRDEWLKALNDVAQPCDPDAFTTQELADLFGVGRSAIKDRIQKLLDGQKVIRVTKAVRDSVGRMVRVPAYKLVTHETRPSARKR